MSFYTTLILETAMPIIGIFLTAFFTYRLSKFKFTEPRRKEIIEAQFRKIYIPLINEMRILNTTPSVIFQKVKLLCSDNIELFSDELVELIDNYQVHEKEETLNEIFNYLDTQYELCKKYLGYPSSLRGQILIPSLPNETRANSTVAKIVMICMIVSSIVFCFLTLAEINHGENSEYQIKQNLEKQEILREQKKELIREKEILEHRIEILEKDK